MSVYERLGNRKNKHTQSDTSVEIDRLHASKIIDKYWHEKRAEERKRYNESEPEQKRAGYVKLLQNATVQLGVEKSKIATLVEEMTRTIYQNIVASLDLENKKSKPTDKEIEQEMISYLPAMKILQEMGDSSYVFESKKSHAANYFDRLMNNLIAKDVRFVKYSRSASFKSSVISAVERMPEERKTDIEAYISKVKQEEAQSYIYTAKVDNSKQCDACADMTENAQTKINQTSKNIFLIMEELSNKAFDYMVNVFQVDGNTEHTMQDVQRLATISSGVFAQIKKSQAFAKEYYKTKVDLLVNFYNRLFEMEPKFINFMPEEIIIKLGLSKKKTLNDAHSQDGETV